MRREWLLPLGAYLAVVAWLLQSVAAAPRTSLPHVGDEILHDVFWRALERGDQQMVVARTAYVAETAPTRPWRLGDDRQCHPLAGAARLGEHMLGFGLLAVVPYHLGGRDPVLAYNVALALTLLIPALAMYALVLYWTRDRLAAFVAGLLFGFAPVRVLDPTHVFVHGDLWSPLAILCADRLFVRERWRDAAALAAVLVLAQLESVYPLVSLALVGGVYGTVLAVRFRHRLVALAPKLAAVAAIAGGAAAMLFLPYLEMREVWGVLHGRPALPLPARELLPGATSWAYPGHVLLALAAVGLFGRARRPWRDRPYDPRLPLLAGGLLSLWVVLAPVPIPGTGIVVPSGMGLLMALAPALEAARALTVVRIGLTLALAFLAGAGVHLLLAGRARPWRLAGGVAVTAVALAELLWAPAGRPWRGTYDAWSPPGVEPELAALVQRAPEGGVAEYPPPGLPPGLGHSVFLAAYHRRPTAACYNSFQTPLQDEVTRAVGALPGPDALDALYALGFRSVLVHWEYLLEQTKDAVRSHLPQAASANVRLARIGAVGEHELFAIEGRLDTVADVGVIRAGSGAPQTVQPPAAEVGLKFRNAATVRFRHPEPIQPTPVVFRWSRTGTTVERPGRLLLPVSIAPEAVVERRVPVSLPPDPGLWMLTVHLAEGTQRTLASRLVTVAAAGVPAGATAALGRGR